MLDNKVCLGTILKWQQSWVSTLKNVESGSYAQQVYARTDCDQGYRASFTQVAQSFWYNNVVNGDC